MNNIKLHKKQQGQLVIMAMFGMVPLVLLIGFIFNTGEQVSSKIRVQNAADAAAITQATWAARSMNVMSINNTALSQTYSVTIVGYSAYAVMVEALQLMLKEQKEILDIVKGCNALPCVEVISCAAKAACYGYAGAREGFLLGEILPRWVSIVEDLGVGDFYSGFITPTKMIEYHEITEALSAMNDEIVAKFPEYSKTVSKEVAKLNGLTDVPRFYAGYKGGDVVKREKNLTTGLPVRKIEFLQGAFKSVFGIAPLKATSEKGTHDVTYSTLLKRYYDFDRHGYTTAGSNRKGYKKGRGPHSVAYNQTKKAVDRLTGKDGLNRSPIPGVIPPKLPGPGKKVKRDFSDVEDACWNIMSPLQNLPLDKYIGTGCLAPIPAIGNALSIYEVEQDFLTQAVGASLWTDPNDLSILAYVERSRSGGAIFPSRFGSSVGAEFGYAQAEIFNDKHPDLYTQHWRAILRPSTLLVSNKRSEAIDASKDFSKLHTFLNSFSKQEQEYLNAH